LTDPTSEGSSQRPGDGSPYDFLSEGPDPSPFIVRLSAEDAFHREAAAWSLGNIGNQRAARPLAGLFLREISTVERSGYLDHGAVVCAVTLAIRKLGATEALYALFKGLTVLARSKGVDRETIEEIIETIAEVGGPNAVREAADRVIQTARTCDKCPGLEVVGTVLLEYTSLCGDAAVSTIRRVARNGPVALQPMAKRVLGSLSLR